MVTCWTVGHNVCQKGFLKRSKQSVKSVASVHLATSRSSVHRASERVRSTLPQRNPVIAASFAPIRVCDRPDPFSSENEVNEQEPMSVLMYGTGAIA
jgi:hypothetical protein